MAERDEIITFCDDLLEIERFEDYGPNGLQVPGRSKIEKVVTGVSAHRELLTRAVGSGAQMLLAHHGLFWDFLPRALSEQMAKRLRIAIEADLSVAAYHLPLDAHREIGNNALLCRRLGLDLSDRPFAEVKGRSIGAIGTSANGLAPGQLTQSIRDLLQRPPLVFEAGPETIRAIGIVSGAGASEIHEAVRLGLDAFVTGEPAEHAMADAKEGGVHFIAAGHYATETFGIRALGEIVAERFDLEHEYIDIPNPV